MNPCSDCLKAKARQKNISKDNEKSRSVIAGERLGFDISSIQDLSLGGSKYWLLVVDEASSMCWSFFLKRKAETSTKIHGLICELKDRFNKVVKFLRCDMQVKTRRQKNTLRRKVLEFSSNTRRPILHNRMQRWKGSLLLSMVGSGLLLTRWAMMNLGRNCGQKQHRS